jgi:phenylpropionate dioxygenase-like ring-hydroxylating dioxygenase large terminal subunit
MTTLLDESAVVQRIFDHIDNRTTDLSEGAWREPVANYRSQPRFEAELQILRRMPTAFCPSAALTKPGAFVARTAAGIPLLATRGADGVVRAFRNACRHRGAQLACGAGQAKAFVCPYHGWTYALNGALQAAPHDYGFPGLDKAARGLVPVMTEERDGLVFVTQEPTADGTSSLEVLPPMLGSNLQLVSSNAREVNVNWKIAVEGFLEGYHIYATHRNSFYPVQYDNINVVEQFGRNSRIAFPYRAIEKLRSEAPAQRVVEGKLTFVYHLFPNVMIATLPKRLLMVVLEPVSVGVTNYVNYMLAEPRPPGAEKPAASRAAELDGKGAREDREVVESIQRGLDGGANEFLEFGRFEGAIAHFHRGLDAALAERA